MSTLVMDLQAADAIEACQKHMTLCQAARLLPGRPHRGTVQRWIHKGVKVSQHRTVRLAAVKMGGRWYVTPEAIQRFTAACTDAATGTNEKTPPAATTGHKAAMRRLKKLGLL